MSQQFTIDQECHCEDNEKEVRKVLKIELGSNDAELLVTELIGKVEQSVGEVEQSERVSKGQVTTQFGRSFDELLKLGPGLHRICDCQRIGAKDAIFKPRQE